MSWHNQKIIRKNTSENLKTIKPNGMQMLLNGQKGKESPKKERST